MGDRKPPRVFLDTSALFAGIWSEVGGGRAILKLGEAGAIQILCSSQVLSELEEAFREKAPEVLSRLVLLIDAANIETSGTVPESIRKQALRLIKYPADAEVLASAIVANIQYFVTLDKQHFLSNRKLRTAVTFGIGTPSDFLAWFRTKLTQEQL